MQTPNLDKTISFKDLLGWKFLWLRINVESSIEYIYYPINDDKLNGLKESYIRYNNQLDRIIWECKTMSGLTIYDIENEIKLMPKYLELKESLENFKAHILKEYNRKQEYNYDSFTSFLHKKTTLL